MMSMWPKNNSTQSRRTDGDNLRKMSTGRQNDKENKTLKILGEYLAIYARLFGLRWIKVDTESH